MAQAICIEYKIKIIYIRKVNNVPMRYDLCKDKYLYKRNKNRIYIPIRYKDINVIVKTL
jgi:hypothetical protein